MIVNFLLLLRNSLLEQAPETTRIVMSLAIILLAGFGLTRITKLMRLPNVTAYIVSGVIIGPYGLNLISKEFIESTSFLSDVSLSLIAFSAGQFFKMKRLKRGIIPSSVIALTETLFCSLLMFIVCRFILRINLPFSLILSSIAGTTAPTSTIMTIRQKKAKGNFVYTLIQVIAVDDLISLLSFSISLSIAIGLMNHKFSMMDVFMPVMTNLIIIIAGGLQGVLLRFLLPDYRSEDNRLIIVLAILLGFSGICALYNVSPLLGCMSMGMVYINISKDEKLFEQVNIFSPPILMLFFVRSGLNFKMDGLFNNSMSVDSIPLTVLVLVYFVVRFAGKYTGAFIGCKITGKDDLTTKNLGLALFPQAGVAIALAAMASRSLGGSLGLSLETVVVATSILYEFIGPAMAKSALKRAKTY
ncbi:MAG: cation:proton antiporter [Bacillota bacterium]|nr:cation:proton antiporter [Bacillota bacterium]NLL26521.1 cation:proton antiporter [Erysipelotrichia bacterium]